MNTWILAALIALPLVGAGVCLLVSRAQAATVARAAAALTLLAALLAGAAYDRAGASRLAGAWRDAARQALERRGVQDVALQDQALTALAAGPLPAARAAELAEGWAGVAELERALDVRERRYALGLLDGIGPIEEARAALADARAEADRLAPLVADLEREVGPLRDAARSPRGGLLFGVAAHAWLTPAGAPLIIGADGLSLVLATLVALLAAVASGSLTGDGGAARGAAAGVLLATAGAEALAVSLDLVGWAAGWTALGAGLVVLARASGPLRRAAWVSEAVAWVGGAGGAAALVLGGATSNRILLADAAASPNAQAIGLALLLLGCAARLPLGAAPRRWLAAEALPPGLAAFTASIGFVTAGAALLRVAWPLCPAIVGAPAVAGAIAAAGVVQAARVGLLALGDPDPTTVAARLPALYGGVLLVGLAAGTPLAHAGVGLTLVAYGLAGTAATLAAGALANRTGGAPEALGGLAPRLPRLAALSAAALLILAGAPGGAGFPALLAVIAGAWTSPRVPGALGMLLLPGLVLGGAALAWAWSRAFLGARAAAPRPDRDVTGQESLALVPLVAVGLVVGWAPTLALDWIAPAVRAALAAPRGG